MDPLLYAGWVDSKTNELVDEKTVKGQYEIVYDCLGVEVTLWASGGADNFESV